MNRFIGLTSVIILCCIILFTSCNKTENAIKIEQQSLLFNVTNVNFVTKSQEDIDNKISSCQIAVYSTKNKLVAQKYFKTSDLSKLEFTAQDIYQKLLKDTTYNVYVYVNSEEFNKEELTWPRAWLPVPQINSFKDRGILAFALSSFVYTGDKQSIKLYTNRLFSKYHIKVLMKDLEQYQIKLERIAVENVGKKIALDKDVPDLAYEGDSEELNLDWNEELNTILYIPSTTKENKVYIKLQGKVKDRNNASKGEETIVYKAYIGDDSNGIVSKNEERIKTFNLKDRDINEPYSDFYVSTEMTPIDMGFDNPILRAYGRGAGPQSPQRMEISFFMRKGNRFLESLSEDFVVLSDSRYVSPTNIRIQEDAINKRYKIIMIVERPARDYDANVTVRYKDYSTNFSVIYRFTEIHDYLLDWDNKDDVNYAWASNNVEGDWIKVASKTLIYRIDRIDASQNNIELNYNKDVLKIVRNLNNYQIYVKRGTRSFSEEVVAMDDKGNTSSFRVNYTYKVDSDSSSYNLNWMWFDEDEDGNEIASILTEQEIREIGNTSAYGNEIVELNYTNGAGDLGDLTLNNFVKTPKIEVVSISKETKNNVKYYSVMFKYKIISANYIDYLLVKTDDGKEASLKIKYVYIRD